MLELRSVEHRIRRPFVVTPIHCHKVVPIQPCVVSGSVSGKIDLFNSVLIQCSLIACTSLLGRDDGDFVIVAIVRVRAASLPRPLAFDTVLLLNGSSCYIAFLSRLSTHVYISHAITLTLCRFRSSRISSGLKVSTSRSSSDTGLGLRGITRRDLSASKPR